VLHGTGFYERRLSAAIADAPGYTYSCVDICGEVDEVQSGAVYCYRLLM
jgi:hypothetical protein